MNPWDKPPREKSPDTQEPTGETGAADPFIQHNLAQMDQRVQEILARQRQKFRQEQATQLAPDLQRGLNARQQVAATIADEAVEAENGVTHWQAEVRTWSKPDAATHLTVELTRDGNPKTDLERVRLERLAQAERQVDAANHRVVVTRKAYEALVAAEADPEKARRALLKELEGIDETIADAERLNAHPSLFIPLKRKRKQTMEALQLLDREIGKTGYDFTKKP